MRRACLTILAAAAVYGFSIGSLHSVRLAVWDLAKFPLLVFTTCAVCSLAWFACTLLVTRRLTFADVMGVSLRTFADLSALLASLAPVAYFLAKTVVQPTEKSLNEYPFFVGLNVAFIAACGTFALVRQTIRLVREHRLGLGRSVVVVAAWLAVSLFAGGQCAWYMRPFFGRSTIRDPPFMERTNCDDRGTTNFYEAVYHLVSPLPPLGGSAGRSRR